MATCAQCGRESTGRFCGGCGAPLPQPAGGQHGPPSGPPAAGPVAPPWQQQPPPGQPWGPSGTPDGQPAGGNQPWGSTPTRPSFLERVYRGRPLRQPAAVSWIGGAVARNPRGSLVSLVVGWFNVAFALWLVPGGAILGAVTGSVGGIAGLTSAVADIPVVGEYILNLGLNLGGVAGGIVGFILGALGAFLGGLVGPWLLIAQDDPVRVLGLVVGQIVTAVVVALVYTVCYHAFEGTVVRIAGARQPSRRESELLTPILRECVHNLGIRGAPVLMMDDSREVNAYAMGRHVVVNQGLLDEFDYDRDVITGVLAHELTHWHNADAVAMSFVRGLCLPVYVPFQIFKALQAAFRRSPIFYLVFGLLAWPFFVLVRYVIAPANALDSRVCEFRADQGAVAAGSRAGLRRFLARIRNTTDGAVNGWDAAICATHPPTEHRLERIEEPGTSYPLPDPDGPTRHATAAGTSSLQRD